MAEGDLQVALNLVEQPIDLSQHEQDAVELTVLELFRGPSRPSKVFRICCYNSKHRAGQLSLQYFKKIAGLEKLDYPEISKLRKLVNKFAKSDRAAQLLPVIPLFADEEGCRIKFLPNPQYRPAAISNRFLNIDELVRLERPESVEGGHLRAGAHLIVQGRTPLLIRPTVAEVVLDNLQQGIRYQFVLPPDDLQEIALAVAVLLNVNARDEGSLKSNLAKMGYGLEIHLFANVWPWVISVHNANDADNAKCYIKLDVGGLLELHSGRSAYLIADQIRNAMFDRVVDAGDAGWIRSKLEDEVRSSLLNRVVDLLKIRISKTFRAELEKRLFGTTVEQ